MTGRPFTDEGRLVEAGAVARRTAMLLSGGAQPTTLWRVLEHDDRVGAIAQHVNRAQQLGVSIPRALSERGLNSIAAVWEVAEKLGSPIADALSRLAHHSDAMLRAAHDRRIAFAGPRSTTKLITALPLVALGFGFVLGFDPIAELTGSILGWIITLSGLLLLLAGRVWSLRLLRNAEGQVHAPGYTHELMAIALTGGFSVNQARLHATTALDTYPVVGASLTDFTRNSGSINSLIIVAEQAGVSLTQLLRSEADALRAEHVTSAQERAAKLAVALLLPLGLCVLPSFILLGVMPMLFSVFNGSLLAG